MQNKFPLKIKHINQLLKQVSYQLLLLKQNHMKIDVHTHFHLCPVADLRWKPSVRTSPCAGFLGNSCPSSNWWGKRMTPRGQAQRGGKDLCCRRPSVANSSSHCWMNNCCSNSYHSYCSYCSYCSYLQERQSIRRFSISHRQVIKRSRNNREPASAANGAIKPNI